MDQSMQDELDKIPAKLTVDGLFTEDNVLNFGILNHRQDGEPELLVIAATFADKRIDVTRAVLNLIGQSDPTLYTSEGGRLAIIIPLPEITGVQIMQAITERLSLRMFGRKDALTYQTTG